MSVEKKQKIKHHSAKHQWLLVEKSDDNSTLTIANQDGAVEFVGGGGSGQPTNITGDTNINVNQSGYNASISLNKDLYQIEAIENVQTDTEVFVHLNDGMLYIGASQENYTDMSFRMIPDEGMYFEVIGTGDNFFDYKLTLDDSGLYMEGMGEDDIYLNYFMTTPNSSNPIATQSDLSSIDTGVMKLNSLAGSINIISPDSSVGIQVQNQQIQLTVSSANIDIHNDGITLIGDAATLSSISNCIHTTNGTLNTIVATIEYTATSDITDNTTAIIINSEEFEIPATIPVIAYDTTINNSIQLRGVNTNTGSLYSSERGHTYIITLYFSYISEGGNN